MKYPHLLRILKEEPLLITPAAHNSILLLLENRMAGNEPPQRETEYCGDKVALDSMQVIDGIAHIPIGGAIGQKLGNYEKMSGAVDVSDVAKDIAWAEKSADVRGVIFDIDSPGGMVAGTPELADKIAAMEKPKYAFTNGQIASAAYWLAAATDGIFATRTADIGSIGVYIPWADQSERFKEAGVKVELIKSGKYKGMGFPGTSLSDEQKQLLQDRVDMIAEMFYEHVKSNRPGIKSDSMQGQTFMAQQAKNLGLIDEIVGDLPTFRAEMISAL